MLALRAARGRGKCRKLTGKSRRSSHSRAVAWLRARIWEEQALAERVRWWAAKHLPPAAPAQLRLVPWPFTERSRDWTFPCRSLRSWHFRCVNQTVRRSLEQRQLTVVRFLWHCRGSKADVRKR